MRTLPSSALPELRPKILLFGATGSGKTVTALSLPGKKLVIDGEKGAVAYRRQFEFDVPAGPAGEPVFTDDPTALEKMIDDLLSDPDGYTVLVIDPITVFHQRMMEFADAALRPRAEAKRRDMTPYDSAMQPGAWGRINQNFRRLMSKLRRLDMAVVVTARERVLLEAVGDSFRAAGSTFAAAKDLDYEFDTVLRLRALGEQIVAKVEKFRGQKVSGDVSNFSAAWLVERFGEAGFTRPAAARPVLREEQEREVESLIQILSLTPDAVARALSKYGVNSVAELSPEQAMQDGVRLPYRTL